MTQVKKVAHDLSQKKSGFFIQLAGRDSGHTFWDKTHISGRFQTHHDLHFVRQKVRFRIGEFAGIKYYFLVGARERYSCSVHFPYCVQTLSTCTREFQSLLFFPDSLRFFLTSVEWISEHKISDAEKFQKFFLSKTLKNTTFRNSFLERQYIAK